MVPLLSACTTPAAWKTDVAAPETFLSTERYEKEYRFLPDDQIEVVVQRAPEVSRSVLIRPDGNISLPLLGDVKAAGLSAPELTAQLTELFAKRLINPEVAVIATRVRPSTVYVAGEVATTAAVALRDAPTAAQAIAMVGGFRKSGAVDDVVIIRLNESGHLQAIPITRVSGGQPGAYMALKLARLEADDLIFVPENYRSQFSRGMDDFVNKPLSGLNSILAPYFYFRVLK
jgi:polysaccharide export outer membrane protein